jgi:putative addiction module component (TIGR02574 family)
LEICWLNIRDPAKPLHVAPHLYQSYPSCMSTIVEVEKLALDLPEKERATLAANLLDSLPGILSEDDGVAEALRRNAEAEADPSQAISLAELDSQIQGRRG